MIRTKMVFVGLLLGLLGFGCQSIRDNSQHTKSDHAYLVDHYIADEKVDQLSPPEFAVYYRKKMEQEARERIDNLER